MLNCRQIRDRQIIGQKWDRGGARVKVINFEGLGPTNTSAPTRVHQLPEREQGNQ
jgi:hypothetical protein